MTPQAILSSSSVVHSKSKAGETKSNASDNSPLAFEARKQRTHFSDVLRDGEEHLKAVLMASVDVEINSNQTFKEFATRTHAQLQFSYEQHFSRASASYEHAPVAQTFIDSARALHTATLHAFEMFKTQGLNAETHSLLATLAADHTSVMELATPALDTMGASVKSADDDDAAAHRAHRQNVLAQIVQGGGFDPTYSLDIELMGAVFSAIDIGSAVAHGAGKTSDLYAKISAMINDLIAMANYFNIVYNEIKAELQKHVKDQAAPPTFSWDQTIDIDGMHNVSDVIRGINTDFYPNKTPYATALLPPHFTEVGIASPDVPIPSNAYLKSLLIERGGMFFISPGIVRQMVDAVSVAMAGITQDHEEGQGQFSMLWGDFATSDGKTSGALQGLSTTISTLSQKSGQTTNLVSIILNSILSLVQKVMDLISASGSARDRISSS